MVSSKSVVWLWAKLVLSHHITFDTCRNSDKRTNRRSRISNSSSTSSKCRGSTRPCCRPNNSSSNRWWWAYLTTWSGRSKSKTACSLEMSLQLKILTSFRWIRCLESLIALANRFRISGKALESSTWHSFGRTSKVRFYSTRTIRRRRISSTLSKWPQRKVRACLCTLCAARVVQPVP